jgi:hypothetical protein
MDEFVTKEEFKKFKGILLRHLDKRFGEVFEKIAESEDAEAKLADEAIEKAERAQRHARRIEKKLDEHEH